MPHILFGVLGFAFLAWSGLALIVAPNTDLCPQMTLWACGFFLAAIYMKLL
jgi:hypothetical protein